MVNAALLLNHTVSHVESMEEDACNPKSDLGQIEQDAGLVDEVNTFGASKSFFRRGNSIQNARRAQCLVVSEVPLIGWWPRRALRP